MNEFNISYRLHKVYEELQQIARCVYYAKSFHPTRDVEAQLDDILKILGVRSPMDVGLSNSILKK